MNLNLLIDGIVQQTMVLIAQLATSGGIRTPLAHVANEVFMSLSKELELQGLGRKVIADMFGLTLRAYHAKVRRLSESETERGRSLWEAVLAYVQERQTTNRIEVLREFRLDDPMSVIGVLNDLVDAGILLSTGKGSAARYKLVAVDELSGESNGPEELALFVWVVIFREGRMTREQLAERLRGIPEDALAGALVLLEASKRVSRSIEDGTETYSSREFVVPVSTSAGWEAAVFDHFQAVATAVGSKAQHGQRKAEFEDRIGGSTFHFDLDENHPLRDEALELFRRLRRDGLELRQRLEVYASNPTHEVRGPFRLTVYAGHAVSPEDAENSSASPAEKNT